MRLRIGVALAIVIIAAAVLLAGPLSRGYQLSEILSGQAPLLPGGNRAAAGAADLTGRATLGADARPATFHVACDPAGTGLSAALTVPRVAEPGQGFDFAGLEGSGSEAPLTGILGSSAGSVRSVRMPAQGTTASGPDAGFTLTVTGGRRGDDPLRGIALALPQPATTPPGPQPPPRPGPPAPTATVTVAEADAAALKSALAGCLAAPF